MKDLNTITQAILAIDSEDAPTRKINDGKGLTITRERVSFPDLGGGLTYVENENQNCEGNGKYWLDLCGHQVLVCVWPTGLKSDGNPFVSIDLLNGSAPEGSDELSIYYTEISDPENPLLEAVLLFHEAVVKSIVDEEEAFMDFLLVPLGIRLTAGMAAYIHGLPATKEAA